MIRGTFKFTNIWEHSHFLRYFPTNILVAGQRIIIEMVYLHSPIHQLLPHRFTFCKASETHQLAYVHSMEGRCFLLHPVAAVKS